MSISAGTRYSGSCRSSSMERSGNAITAPLKAAMGIVRPRGSTSALIPKGGRPLVMVKMIPRSRKDLTAPRARSVSTLSFVRSVPSTSVSTAEIDRASCAFLFSISYLILAAESFLVFLTNPVRPVTTRHNAPLLILSSRYWTGFRLPYVDGVLLDRPVARKLSRTPDIQHGFARPVVRVGVRIQQALVCLTVRSEVRQVHVVVSTGQEGIEEWRKNFRFIAAEVVGGDQVQSRARFWLIFIVPARVVPSAAVCHLIRCQPE